jgi:hypothetical protein
MGLGGHLAPKEGMTVEWNSILQLRPLLMRKGPLSAVCFHPRSSRWRGPAGLVGRPLPAHPHSLTSGSLSYFAKSEYNEELTTGA